MPQLSAQQNANIPGSSNVVVQIVGDGNVVQAGPVLVLYDDEQHAEANPARAGQAGYTRTGRREMAILAPQNLESIRFVGRADLLDALRTWLDDPARLSIHVLTGAGGQGKTRLAAELAAESRRDAKWTAGFARKDELDVFRAHNYRTGCAADTLVIIDYAAAKAEFLRAWLSRLVRAKPPQHRLRLLLLERGGGNALAWWREVFESGSEGELIRNHLDPAAPLEVGQLAHSDERHALFAAAHRTASDSNPPPRSPALDLTLAQISLGGAPLFLAMFGLLAGRNGIDAVKALSADRLALTIAEDELGRIERVWRAHGLPVGKDRKFHAHLAALAALCEGWDEPAAITAIESEQTALRIATLGTEEVRAALAAALPGPAGGIAPIQPDVIAEAAMIQAWRLLPDGGESVVRRAAATHRPAVTRSVVRACQDYLIRGEATPLRWLQVIRADAATLEDLAMLGDALPLNTVELREVAAELAQAIVVMAREQGAEAVLAMALNNLSVHLSHLGRREAALEAVEEAVAIRRTLSQARPDAFLPDLAMALNNLSNHLSHLGRREAALEAVEEAVATYRTLSQARPDAFLPDLAMALNNLSNHLSDLGRREAALEAVEEAVATYRTLSQARPDAFLPDLAMALNNLSNHLSDLGRREAALEAVEEAVAIRRTLSQARPDAFLPDLASALNNLSNRLSHLGRREAALEAVEEAVAIRRTLSQARPDAFLPDLASALNNLSNRLSHLGRREAALEAVEEAVATYRTLSQARPDAFLPDLASALNNLSNRLSDLGRREAALPAVEEAVAIRRTLSQARPDAFLPDLAMALNNLSNHLSDLGRREAALEAVEEAVATYRTLSQARPDAFLPDLATALGARGAILRDADPAKAAESFGAGIAALGASFLALPAAFASLMGALCRGYIGACEQAGIEPDMALLTPIAETFGTLNEPGGEHGPKAG